MDIRSAYQASVEEHGHTRDVGQEAIVNHLAELQASLARVAGPFQKLRRTLRLTREEDCVTGLYLWGDVGRGKTFLMDLFFETLHLKNKMRIHFHRMMADVHRRLKNLGDVVDPLDKVGADISRQARVLCFDEFFISDIADAMILGRLLDSLFRRGVTLVATSNSPPQELYANGLQRERFLPAIEMLETRTRVLNLDGDTDYRLRLLQQAGTYLTPIDADAFARLSHYFEEVASGDVVEGRMLDILGRDIATVPCRIAGELGTCRGPFSEVETHVATDQRGRLRHWIVSVGRCRPRQDIPDGPFL